MRHNVFEIWSNVICGANITNTDTGWYHVNRKKANSTLVPSAHVIIGSNVWLTMNVIVLKGVTIGPNAVITANSVVNKDISGGVFAAGQSAKVLKQL